MTDSVKIGVSGTGFIAKGLISLLASTDDMKVVSILTRRPIETVEGIQGRQALTNDIDTFLKNVDLIVECSGDVIHGSEVIDQAFKMNLPVVTMNSELQVTTGSYFAKRGFITEAEGDQPGCLAALHENALSMGFKPLVYGNIKGFMNLNPSLEDMTYWSKAKGISLPMVTSFTDGTKVQIEQALVANGLHAGILADGLTGETVENIEIGGQSLAEKTEHNGKPISDFVVCRQGPPGVFITARHDGNQKEALSYLKLGEGPYYTLSTSFHLCHLEIIKTIRRVVDGKGILLNNTAHPSVSVKAVAKRDLTAGETISQGIGSFVVRGEACSIEDNPDHLPIGLLSQAVIEKPVKAGETLTFSNVSIPGSFALNAWNDIIKDTRPVFS
ncbi:NAD(P)-dependent oxidoreductase [Salipaludibacillus agaradhaerens]|uniref:NAD(P)-dependent oxidoreductase n=1 Tax=Salipaludibacillus agaradhaerens TaxID=76935 RepID=UPI000997F0D8|nr:NAD(P)-dependent oxidoreductase [Salipaludibacillus agaradhaerens]